MTDFDGFFPEFNSTSPTVRPERGTPQPAKMFRDTREAFSLRQIEFYRNLLGLSAALDCAKILPMYFDIRGQPHYLDHGCVKMAANTGFLKPLENGPDGLVRQVELAW